VRPAAEIGTVLIRTGRLLLFPGSGGRAAENALRTLFGTFPGASAPISALRFRFVPFLPGTLIGADCEKC
jgi:hypothetical protein